MARFIGGPKWQNFRPMKIFMLLLTSRCAPSTLVVPPIDAGHQASGAYVTKTVAGLGFLSTAAALTPLSCNRNSGPQAFARRDFAAPMADALDFALACHAIDGGFPPRC